jgi:hypothetical protein
MAEKRDGDAVDPKDAFKAALDRKNAQAKGGPGASSNGPAKGGAGSTKAAGGRRTFQRKSGSS